MISWSQKTHANIFSDHKFSILKFLILIHVSGNGTTFSNNIPSVVFLFSGREHL